MKTLFPLLLLLIFTFESTQNNCVYILKSYAWQTKILPRQPFYRLDTEGCRKLCEERPECISAFLTQSTVNVEREYGGTCYVHNADSKMEYATYPMLQALVWEIFLKIEGCGQEALANALRGKVQNVNGKKYKLDVRKNENVIGLTFV
uniref:Apple domain-containing protein n=1 Tax=Caenorhabditis tropicalis TaxID=1561998 RepID=A0A1I7UW25_9PELO